MKNLLIFAVLAGLLASPAVFAQGGDVTAASQEDLAKIIQWQNKKLEELQDRVEALEAGAPEDEGDNLVVPKVADKITLSGDLRYRHEFIDSEMKSSDRNRHRIRARIGLKAKLSDELDLGFRLASGSSDPTSTNQTLDGAFSTKGINLDRAYFDYHPDWCEGLSILGGKFSNPFDTHNASALLFDGDLSVEGMALVSEADLDAVQTYLAIGGLWVDEDSSGANSMLWGAQGSATMPIEDMGHARAGVGYYGYSDIKGHTALAGNTAGNSFVGGVYAEDFGVAEVFAELEAKLADNLKGTVYGSYANNTQADGDLDSAYMVGAKLGTKIAGKKVSFKYDWRDIEADATIGALNDSDFGGGGTDARGHRFGASIKPTDRTEVAVTYLMNEVGIDDSAGKGSAEYDYDRVQFDLKFKF